MDKILYRLI